MFDIWNHVVEMMMLPFTFADENLEKLSFWSINWSLDKLTVVLVLLDRGDWRIDACFILV